MLLAACRAQESAYECPFGDETHCALTWWLLQLLNERKAGMTYAGLHAALVGMVHGTFAEQTPVLVGDENRLVPGTASAPTQARVAVLEVDRDLVRINAGSAQGIRKGMTLAIHPPAPDPAGALASATVADVVAMESRALDLAQIAGGNDQRRMSRGAA